MKKLVKNMLTYSLKNGYVEVYIIPELGGKISSIKYNDGFDPVFSKRSDYIKPNDFIFSNYDTSGIDDCIPTIDECQFNGSILPDHGEVWAKKMDVIDVDYSSITLKLDLTSLNITFIKKISLIDNTVRIDYRVNSQETLPYLWAFHGLMKLEGCKKIIEPHKNMSIIQVDGFDMPIDYTNINGYTDNKTYKYYYTSKIEDGTFGLEYENHILKYKFDSNTIPYVGVWITTGGFKSEKNIAIEPTNGFYDSLIKAIENDKYTTVEANGSNKWYIEISIERK